MDYLIVTAALIKKDDQILIAQRKHGSHLALKWEFPGGKLSTDETPEEGLVREIQEELGITINVKDIYKVVAHTYPDKKVLLLCYECEYIGGEVKALDCNAFKWINSKELSEFDMAPADLPIVEKVISHLKKIQ